MAVERLKSCENIVALSEELGVQRRLLYKWRDQLEAIEDDLGRPANSRAHRLDESPAGYSLGGWSPPEPASASPAEDHCEGEQAV